MESSIILFPTQLDGLIRPNRLPNLATHVEACSMIVCSLCREVDDQLNGRLYLPELWNNDHVGRCFGEL
jgi:hypothetical protein